MRMESRKIVLMNASAGKERDEEVEKQLLLIYIASGIISCIAVILAAGRLRKRKDVKRCVKKQS